MALRECNGNTALAAAMLASSTVDEVVEIKQSPARVGNGRASQIKSPPSDPRNLPRISRGKSAEELQRRRQEHDELVSANQRKLAELQTTHRMLLDNARRIRQIVNEAPVWDAVKAFRHYDRLTKDEYKRQMGVLKRMEDQMSALQIKNVSLEDNLEKTEQNFQDSQIAKTLGKQEEKASVGRRLPLNLFNLRRLGGSHKSIECAICLDQHGLNEFVALECKHAWGVKCLRGHIQARLGNRIVEEGRAIFSCPACRTAIGPVEARYCLPPDMYAKFLQALTDDHLKRDENTRWCPKCETPMIGDKQRPMCSCPKCSYKFCFNCKTDEWHDGVTCAAFQKWKVENKQGDAMYQEWRAKNTKACPRCKGDIEKNGGCDHMTCRRPGCGYEFYWSTLKPYGKWAQR